MQPALIAAFAVVAACASRGAPAPGEAAAGPVPPVAHGTHEHGLAATAGAGFTTADVRFMQAMIGHHAQALTMAALAPRNGAATEVLRLAQKIDISQRDEIEMMQAWLVQRGQPVPGPDDMHHMHMPGMVTEERLAQLRAARGREFDRLFLTLMIQHHEGALEMVESLFASPGAAQDPDIFRFVTDVAADQLDEIDQMQYVLDMIAANRRSESR